MEKSQVQGQRKEQKDEVYKFKPWTYNKREQQSQQLGEGLQFGNVYQTILELLPKKFPSINKGGTIGCPRFQAYTRLRMYVWMSHRGHDTIIVCTKFKVKGRPTCVCNYKLLCTHFKAQKSIIFSLSTRPL